MEQNKKYPGTFISMLYTTQGGKQQRSMPLDDLALAQIMKALQDAGEGAKLVLKETSSAYRDQKQSEINQRGGKGGPATHILEVLSSAELEQERTKAKSQQSGPKARF